MLEFINVQLEIRPFFPAHIGPRQGGKLEATHKERPKQARVRLAQASLAQIRDEYSPIIHHEPEIDLAPDLAENIADGWGEKQLPHFILNRRNDLLAKPLVVQFKFLQPERADNWILTGRTTQVRYRWRSKAPGLRSRWSMTCR